MQSVKKLFDENAELKQRTEAMVKEKIAGLADRMMAEFAASASQEEVIVHAMEVSFSPDHLRDIAFALRSRLSNIAIVLGTKAEGKVNLAVVLGGDVVARGLNAAQIGREAAKAIQGGGGGQPFFAMAGGKKPEGLAEAMDVALRLIHDQLAK